MTPVSIVRRCSSALMVAVAGLVASAAAAQPAASDDLVALGRNLYFDASLSIGGNQACASCHAPETGFSGANEVFNRIGAYEGSIAGRFGRRKPPMAAYAGASPILHREVKEGELTFVGGTFWDGRATGRRLKDPAAEQAQGPLLDSHEQALPDSACVLQKVCASPYADLVRTMNAEACPSALGQLVCRAGVAQKLDPALRRRVNAGYDLIGRALSAYERSAEVSAFTSKFDAWKAGTDRLSDQERRGYDLFIGKAKCNNCHPAEPLSKAERAVFTDFSYDNLGVPRNPRNPWYTQAANDRGRQWVDEGLGGFLRGDATWRGLAAENLGRFKAPSLRNVDKRPHPAFVKSYMHNGYFTSLEAVVSFYNTRDVKPRCRDRFTSESEALAQGCWPAPEIAANLNRHEMGRLGLSQDEEAALVAFMKTLSDGHVPPSR